jgi:hypothetical protein
LRASPVFGVTITGALRINEGIHVLAGSSVRAMRSRVWA